MVIRSNDGEIDILNKVNSLEVQNNAKNVSILRDVLGHIDIKNNMKGA